MDWSIFVIAVGLFLVFEGILPFLSPPRWRQTMQQLFILSDRTVRTIGFVSMLMGLALVTIARDLF